MIELTDIYLFILGFAGSFIGSVAVGGGLLVFPMLLFMGFPPHLALATTRSAAIGTSVGSFIQFLKKKNLGVSWNTIFIITLLTVPSISLGTLIVLSVSSEILSTIMGIALLLLLPIIFVSKSLGVKPETVTGFARLKAHVLYFLGNVWAGFFSPGAGIILAFIQMKFYGFTILQGKAVSRIPLILANVISIYFFIATDFFDYRASLSIFIGALAGSTVGTRLAIRKGNAWIKPLLGVVIIISAIKLLFF